jgi:hypothetical protein
MTKRINSDVHVFPRRTGAPFAPKWEIICDRPYIVAYARTQKMASTLGCALAKLTKTDLVVHGRDGKIKRKDSFGNGPCPPKG